MVHKMQTHVSFLWEIQYSKGWFCNVRDWSNMLHRYHSSIGLNDIPFQLQTYAFPHAITTRLVSIFITV